MQVAQMDGNLVHEQGHGAGGLDSAVEAGLEIAYAEMLHLALLLQLDKCLGDLVGIRALITAWKEFRHMQERVLFIFTGRIPTLEEEAAVWTKLSAVLAGRS